MLNTIQNDDLTDTNLRPKKLSDYIGQDRIKQNINIILEAANKRKESPDHILLYGPPGLGKTTLANIVASELNSLIVTTSGPAIERSGDLASLLTNLEPGSIFFIDEIHRIPKTVEEILYPAMEERVIDLTVGKGPSAKSIRLEVPPFVLIGATTKIGSLSNPFRDRFGSIFHLEFYSDSDIAKILKRSAQILNISIDDESLGILSSRARMTPRIANRLLKRVRDLATVRSCDVINKSIVLETLSILDIDDWGLDNTDRMLLSMIIDHHQGGPVGIKNIAAALSEDPTNIEEVIEPFLMRSGLLKRTPQGRAVTSKAYEVLGKSLSSTNKLL